MIKKQTKEQTTNIVTKTFKEDTLKRFPFAVKLANLIKEITKRQEEEKEVGGNKDEFKDRNGCVIAIDADWGLGKSCFVQKFKNALEKGYKKDAKVIESGYKCLLFDAYKNDFQNNSPLVGFIKDLKKIVN